MKPEEQRDSEISPVSAALTRPPTAWDRYKTKQMSPPPKCGVGGCRGNCRVLSNCRQVRRCPGSEDVRERQPARQTDPAGGRERPRETGRGRNGKREMQTGRCEEKVVRMQQEDTERKMMRRAEGNSNLEIGETCSEGQRQKQEVCGKGRESHC